MDRANRQSIPTALEILSIHPGIGKQKGRGLLLTLVKSDDTNRVQAGAGAFGDTPPDAPSEVERFAGTPALGGRGSRFSIMSLI